MRWSTSFITTAAGAIEPDVVIAIFDDVVHPICIAHLACGGKRKRAVGTTALEANGEGVHLVRDSDAGRLRHVGSRGALNDASQSAILLFELGDTLTQWTGLVGVGLDSCFERLDLTA